MENQSSTCKHGAKVQRPNILGDIFRKYGEAYIDQYKPSLGKIKLIRNIRKCRTRTMGAIIMRCKGCGKSTKIYKSCGDNKCPICQSHKRMRKQAEISNKMLNVPYTHTVFTLPHELNSLLKANPKLLYNLLYRSSWKAVRKLCADTENVGGLPGMIALMHTWGSDLKYHVHLHTLITFGGLDEEGTWQHPKRKKKLYGYRAINKAFRDEYMAGLDKLIAKGELQSVPFMEEILEEVRVKKWVVYNGNPQMDTEAVEDYLGRYIMKIAVSNSRLSYDEVKEQVFLICNNYNRQVGGCPCPK